MRVSGSTAASVVIKLRHKPVLKDTNMIYSKVLSMDAISVIIQLQTNGLLGVTRINNINVFVYM